MPTQEKLREYARLTVRIGANVSEGQYVLLSCPTLAADFGRMVIEEAYAAGARDVIVSYYDEGADRIRLMNADIAEFETVPEWRAESRNYYARNGGCSIVILAEDPDILTGVPHEKLIAKAKSADKAFREFYKMLDSGEMRWTLVAYPFGKWAKKVFPDATEGEAVKKLWSAVFKTVRIGRGDIVKEWEKQDKLLKGRCEKLNRAAFHSLKFENSLGTSLEVGLAKGHIWLGGSDYCSADGRAFFANLPTEECFTMPDKTKVNGTVFSAMPLSHDGQLIDKFSLTFRDGKVVSHTARTGYDALTAVLDTDEGSRRLGEVALIPYSSPISQMKLLFYNTLFDENAACHLALGSCYPNTVAGGEKLSDDELDKIGGNQSANHVDFMFGTSDMNITGLKDGAETKVFESGEFVL